MKRLSSLNLISLLDSYSSVSSALSSEDTLKRIMKEAIHLLNAEAGSIFLIDNETNELYMKIATNLSEEEIKQMRLPLELGIVGRVVKERKLINTRNTKDDKSFYDKIDERTGIKTVSCLTVPLRVEEKVIGVAQLINKKKVKYFDDEDELLITEFAKLACITLDKAILHEQLIQKEKLETDLEIASAIQNRLLPSASLKFGEYEFTGYYKPAKYVGGDYFDFFKIADNEIFFTIGDVTGKGAHASLLMASVEAFLTASFEYRHSLADVVFKLNNFFQRKTPDGIFVTMFFGLLNTTARELTYINAGHTPPMLLRRNGELIKLEATDVVLGVMENWKYEINYVNFAPEDLLLAFTDGVTEAQNIDREMFGNERLESILRANILSPKKLLEEIPRQVEMHVTPNKQSDDISFIILTGCV